MHRRLQPTIGLISSTDTQKLMYSTERDGKRRGICGNVPVPAQSPVTCVAWPSEVWLVDWMNMGWVMSWPAGMVTCWIW